MAVDDIGSIAGTVTTTFGYRTRHSWWRHQMETFSALLALCVGNSPVTGEFPSERSVTRRFDVIFDLCLNKRLSKHSWGCDLSHHRTNYDVTVMLALLKWWLYQTRHTEYTFVSAITSLSGSQISRVYSIVITWFDIITDTLTFVNIFVHALRSMCLWRGHSCWPSTYLLVK